LYFHIFAFFSLYYTVKHHVYGEGNETLINRCQQLMPKIRK